MLSSRRRRYVLHYLLQQEAGASELRELTMQLAAWENDTTVEEVTSKQRMRVYTALRQSHLPKMDREGVLEFDAARGTVELTEEASQLEVYLDIVPHNEIPWSEYYLGLGVISTALVAAVWMGTFPFGLVPDLAWAGLISVLFVASAAFHTYHSREMRLGTDGKPPV
ncbi:hypothetical protein ACFQH6_15815 [Halobacteriaceae archaeon GCM10025711]